MESTIFVRPNKILLVGLLTNAAFNHSFLRSDLNTYVLAVPYPSSSAFLAC
jgi:hypothetical protein